MPTQHARRAKNDHRHPIVLKLPRLTSIQCAQAPSQDSVEAALSCNSH